MKLWQHMKRPPWRTFLLLGAILGALSFAYLLWSPGQRIHDGRHDLRTNGIWIGHGWLGDDSWFLDNGKDKTLFRDDQKMKELAVKLANHGVKYVFPHVCPSDPSGKIAPVDPVQTERFLDHFADFQVVAWIGGVLDVQCSPESPKWRSNFVSSVVDLLQTHPRLGGVQLNIEPMPTGNADFLTLLEDLRKAMPAGKIISIAAYPPPTHWHRFPDVHWEEAYFREVARRADQMVPMMYDTSIRLPKIYQSLMSTWTSEVLDWSGSTQVLLGVPAYGDPGVGYHSPDVENLQNALLGIHAALCKQKELPKHYAGVAIYCEWEMDSRKWSDFRNEFEKAP
ncbi:MAG: glycosyl hydrolase family 18 protein [Verrucomicrobiales bacterium]